MIRRRVLAAVVFVPVLLLFGLVRPSAAQSVVGVVTDGRTGAPVPGTFLSLVDDSDVVQDTVTTDRNGQFRLRASEAGSYAISAEREDYASILSGELHLTGGAPVSYTMELPPVSLNNMQRISETMGRNERLRSGVVELCRGRMNPVEGGILLGVVRDSRTREPVPGAVAHLPPLDDAGVPGTAVTDRHGTYIFCFVPARERVSVRVEAAGYRPDEQVVEIRRGTISWYDFRLRPAGEGG